MVSFGFPVRCDRDAGAEFELGKLTELSGDEVELLCSCKALYACFKPRGGGAVGGAKGTFIGQRRVRSGVFRAQLRVTGTVLGKTADKVGGDAGIETAVRAAKNVCIIGHFTPPKTYIAR